MKQKIWTIKEIESIANIFPQIKLQAHLYNLKYYLTSMIFGYL